MDADKISHKELLLGGLGRLLERSGFTLSLGKFYKGVLYGGEKEEWAEQGGTKPSPLLSHPR